MNIFHPLTGEIFPPVQDLLTRRIEKDASSAEWTLARASDSSQSRSWVEGVLLDCPDERARDSFFRLMLTAARFLAENSHGADKFVMALLGAHANIASSPKYISSYLSVLLGLLRAGGRPAECLQQNQAQLMLAHIVFGDTSPLNSIPRLSATAAGPPDLTDALTCLSLMAKMEPGGRSAHRCFPPSRVHARERDLMPTLHCAEGRDRPFDLVVLHRPR